MRQLHQLQVQIYIFFAGMWIRIDRMRIWIQNNKITKILSFKSQKYFWFSSMNLDLKD